MKTIAFILLSLTRHRKVELMLKIMPGTSYFFVDNLSINTIGMGLVFEAGEL